MHGFFLPANIIDEVKTVAIFNRHEVVTFIPNFHTAWNKIILAGAMY
jgi:hypothetical protein